MKQVFLVNRAINFLILKIQQLFYIVTFIIYTNSKSIGTSSPMQSTPGTKLSQILYQKQKYILKTLVMLGYPQAPLTQLKESQQQQQPVCLLYQATDARLQLIQWLIAMIHPAYKFDQDYKSIYVEDPHLHRVRRYAHVLWMLGVMPVTKYTKNIDYDKYIQGLLGFENSVNLIYDLVQLAQNKFSANITKIEQVAGDLLGELIRHSNQLVNVQYDPYGVTFPNRYIGQENGQQQVQRIYQSIVKQVETVNTENKNSHIDGSFMIQQKQHGQESIDQQQVLKQLEGYKQLFVHKYTKLNKQMEQLIQRYESIIGPSTTNKDRNTNLITKETSELHSRRMLNISKNLCKNYREYKKMIRNMKEQSFSNKLKDMKKEVHQVINQINQLPIFQTTL